MTDKPGSKPPFPENLENSINLNIGAGDYVLPGFFSLDFFSPHYYKNKDM